MSNWAIISVMGNMGVYTEDGRFSPNVFEAKLFDTKAVADKVAETIKTATIVQQLTNATSSKPKYKVPHPDFFESYPPLMELTQVFDQINSEFPTDHFIPVERITGGGQMTGAGIEHPTKRTLYGREYQFSFSRLLGDDDISTIHETFRDDGKWDSVNYQIKRLGFTAYAVLTLRVKNK